MEPVIFEKERKEVFLCAMRSLGLGNIFGEASMRLTLDGGPESPDVMLAESAFSIEGERMRRVAAAGGAVGEAVADMLDAGASLCHVELAITSSFGEKGFLNSVTVSLDPDVGAAGDLVVGEDIVSTDEPLGAYERSLIRAAMPLVEGLSEECAKIPLPAEPSSPRP